MQFVRTASTTKRVDWLVTSTRLGQAPGTQDPASLVVLGSSTMRMVALLRGINVGGNKKVPMAKLREVAGKAGFKDVETYIQSGNLIFTAAKGAADTEAVLERAIHTHFGFPVEVIAREATSWARYSLKTPFPDAAAERPSLLHLGLSKKPPNRDAPTLLGQRAQAGERVALEGDALWIDFAAGAGTSKLTPAALDRAVGSTVTLRNW